MKKPGAVAIQAAGIAIAAFCAGCSTLTTPALKHETGETLGSGRFRLLGKFEMARLYPVPPTGSPAIGVSQDGSLFKGTTLGVQGAVGVLPKVDLQLGSHFLIGGGGWRLGTKVNILQSGSFALAGMLGYGRFSGKTTQQFNTASSTVSVEQNLTASQLDLSLPVSYSFGKDNFVYSGLNFYKTSLSGTVAGSPYDDSVTDIGLNLGYRHVFSGRFEGDVEMALVKAKDPFTGSSQMIPYFGLGAGILF